MSFRQTFSSPFSQELSHFAGSSNQQFDDPMEGVEYHQTVIIAPPCGQSMEGVPGHGDPMEGVVFQNGTSARTEEAISAKTDRAMNDALDLILQTAPRRQKKAEPRSAPAASGPYPTVQKNDMDSLLDSLLESNPVKIQMGQAKKSGSPGQRRRRRR